MNIERQSLTINGLTVAVERKAIKNLHLGVYPPNGRVRVAAPLTVSDNAVRLAVIGKLGWIKRQQTHFSSQLRQSARELVSGETHYVFGRRYRLRVVATDGSAKVIPLNQSRLELHIRPNASAAQKDRALQTWYRQQLKLRIPVLLEKWQPILGVEAAAWGIKKMKTRWGTCTIEAKRIWLNLELAKKKPGCLEYILVHELVHLLERHHNDRFVALMNRYLPHWQHLRRELNAAPLAYEHWSY
jgi:predicted metal-dependent hydrolase